MVRVDPSLPWPPPDPDRIPRSDNQLTRSRMNFDFNEDNTNQDRLAGFRRRQQEDLKRFDRGQSMAIRRQGYRRSEYEDDSQLNSIRAETGDDHKVKNLTKGWQDSNGDRLDDFGVDEDVEYDDEIPLAELLRTKRIQPSRS